MLQETDLTQARSGQAIKPQPMRTYAILCGSSLEKRHKTSLSIANWRIRQRNSGLRHLRHRIFYVLPTLAISVPARHKTCSVCRHSSWWRYRPTENPGFFRVQAKCVASSVERLVLIDFYGSELKHGGVGTAAAAGSRLRRLITPIPTNRAIYWAAICPNHNDQRRPGG